MAARKRNWTPEKVRERIRTTMLVKRLQKYALGEKEQGADVELSQGQLKAIEILLRKRLPDLSAVEHTGEIRQRDVTDQPFTAEQWETQYADRLETPGGSSEGTH
jgi:hypothetical protein